MPTCWQYKAVDAKSVSKSLRKEIHKPYVEELVRKGYGYRLCVLGDVTPQGTCEDWEPLLKAKARLSGRPSLLAVSDRATGNRIRRWRNGPVIALYCRCAKSISPRATASTAK